MCEQACLGVIVHMQIADVEDTTEGGLLMAGSSKEKPTLGTVIICFLVFVQYFVCLRSHWQSAASKLTFLHVCPGMKVAQT